MNKYSCADFTFPLLTHDKVLALLRLLDFGAVDLGIFSGRSHLQPKDIIGDVPAAVARMRQSLDAHELVASDVFLQTGPEPVVNPANSPHEEVRFSNHESFLAVLEFAHGIQCRHLTGLPGVSHAGSSAADDWRRAIDEAAWRRERAAEMGIEYAVEAHVGSILSDPESTLRFVEESGVTLTLDYGHFVYQDMDQARVHRLIDHASHFHARGGKPGGLQTSVDENKIDFVEILKRLKSIHYDGYLCLEYVWVDWEGCNRTDNISETLLLRERLEGEKKVKPHLNP